MHNSKPHEGLNKGGLSFEIAICPDFHKIFDLQDVELFQKDNKSCKKCNRIPSK